MSDSDKNLIDILKKFPDQNPNPVIRVSGSGILEYYNQPSKSIIKFYDLKISKKIGNELLEHINFAISKRVHSFEIKLESLSYSFKCVYIKELDGINMYGTDITAKKVIDKFPDSNPNPVMRVSYQGVLGYYNDASSKLVEALNLKISEPVPNPFLKYVGEVSISGQSTNYEIQVGNYTYAASFVPVPEFQFIIIYGMILNPLIKMRIRFF